MISLVSPYTQSLNGELFKTELLHHVSEAPQKLSEMPQNPAALKNGGVASSTRTLERRSQREITTSWDGSFANLCSPQGDAGRLSATTSPQRSRTHAPKKHLAKHQARKT